MIQDAQRPLLYHGFKIIKINLGTFSKVISIFALKYCSVYLIICFSDFESRSNLLHGVENTN